MNQATWDSTKRFIPREMSVDEFIKIIREAGYDGEIPQYNV